MNRLLRGVAWLFCLSACGASVPPPPAWSPPATEAAPPAAVEAAPEQATQSAPLAAPDPTSAQFESEIRAFEASDRARPPKSGGIVFVGSSSIRLWTTLEQDFARYKVVNRGFGGSQLRNVVDFADRVVIPYAPRLVVLFAGSNDIHAGVPADQLVLDFRTFVARVTGALPSARIAFVSITTSPSRFAEVQTVREVNRRIQEYVATDSKLVFIDVFSRMVDSAGAPRPELYRDDKLHLNEKGYGLWAELIGPYLGPPDSPN